MANKAGINIQASALRSAARLTRLRAALAKAQSRGNTDRASQLQEEIDRRLGELRTIKSSIDDVLKAQ